MFDDFLHQLVSSSFPSYGWRFNYSNNNTDNDGKISITLLDLVSMLA